MDNFDPKLCQVCKEPATYGDGVTWAMCSKHQYETHGKSMALDSETKDEILVEPVEADGFKHETKEGLVSIIVPVFNNNYPTFHRTGDCIGSIRFFTNPDIYELIVVNNGSKIKMEPQSWLCDKLIENETNEGFVKAVNKGIRTSFGEYIAIVTSDVMVFDHWLEDALEALKYKDLVIATPMYGEPYARGYEAFKKREEYMKKPIEDSFSDFKDGACWIAKKELFDEIGLFDERFVNYAADVDFYKRLEMAGKTYASSKRINIVHITQQTGSGVEGNAEQMTKDKQAYIDKWEKPDEVEVPLANRLIRTDVTGDKIYFLVGKTIHWVTSPEVLSQLGYKFGDEKTIEDSVYREYEKGEPINKDNVDSFK